MKPDEMNWNPVNRTETNRIRGDISAIRQKENRVKLLFPRLDRIPVYDQTKLTDSQRTPVVGQD
jgi:hypothetical protein